MRRVRYYQFITEEIVGKYAKVYHRTHTNENIASILRDGFHAGPRALYGKGIYATYELTSQFTNYMVEQYGEFVIRSRVNLDGFLILDRKVATQVYGKAGAGLVAQAKRFKTGQYIDENKIREMEYQIEEEGQPSSQIAYDIVHQKQILGMRGIVYFGRRDGKCVVSYETDTVLPLAWTQVTGETVIQTNQQKMVGRAQRDLIASLVWNKVTNRESVARAMRPNVDRDLVSNPSRIKTIVDPSVEQQLAAVSADPMTIHFIKNPTSEVQIAAVHGDSRAIDLITNPSPEAIVWPLRVRSDNEKLLARLPSETLLAALRLDCTILSSIARYNPNQEPTSVQWEAAWEAPNAIELISWLFRLHPDIEQIDASTLPPVGLTKMLYANPAQLYHFSHVSPAIVAVAVLSPNQDKHNLALGNCNGKNRQVDTSAIAPDQLLAIIQRSPGCIFAIMPEQITIELATTAMKASRAVAADMARRFSLPPELQALAPKPLFF